MNTDPTKERTMLTDDIQLGYNEQTMTKVWQALESQGLTPQQANDCVTAMQNAGILFRERIA